VILTSRRTTVLLADDHPMVRERLVQLLTEHGLIVVGAVGDGHLLIDTAIRLRPDVIVTDISMPPGLSGLDVLARLKAERVDSKLILLTMHNDADMATRAERAGASGFLLKHTAGDELVDAIHQVLQGRVYFPLMLSRDVMNLPVPPDRSEE
jgi:two-component system, NarL family, response regulator NreC